MNDYDFRTLNDKEFEVLCCDLISAREAVTIERFKPGRDLGVDGRFFGSPGKEVILQCKHWPGTPIEKLIKHLEAEELPKVAKLASNRYILILSHPLSRVEKQKILKIFSPYIKYPTDVIGREDLNDILSKNPRIEERHYKLWLASTNVLRHLLNKAIHERSTFALEEIISEVQLYVPTANHDAALRKLESLGTVVISGPAGVGKTTLADHLILHYVAKDYELVKISEDIREAESAYVQDGNQVFYFDDFLGRNYLEALSGHEGSHIVHFIKRISRDKKKRFVLTSRSTILNQGKLLNDIFQNNNLARNEFEITLESYTEMDRARILYNHIWCNTLEASHVDEIYKNKRYRNIINHRNYNPRLIRYITDSGRFADLKKEEYWPTISALLNNPAKVWENPFEAQHDDFGRSLVLLVTLNGAGISQLLLAEAYSRLISRVENASMHGRRDFLANVKHLSGSLLARTIDKSGNASFNLFSPSVGDYVLHRYACDIPALQSAFLALKTPSSLRTISDLGSNKLIEESSAKDILIKILKLASDSDFIGYSSEYISLALEKLITISKSKLTTDPTFQKSAIFVCNAECPLFFKEAALVTKWALNNKIINEQQASDFICRAIRNQPHDEELEVLGSILKLVDDNLPEDIISEATDAAVLHLTNSVHDIFSDGDVFEELDPGDFDNAELKLRELIADRAVAYGLEFSEEEINRVVEAYDVPSRNDVHFGNDDPYDDPAPVSGEFHIDEVDDLFDRHN